MKNLLSVRSRRLEESLLLQQESLFRSRLVWVVIASMINNPTESAIMTIKLGSNVVKNAKMANLLTGLLGLTAMILVEKEIMKVLMSCVKRKSVVVRDRLALNDRTLEESLLLQQESRLRSRLVWVCVAAMIKN